ncbi:uncharacterized protein METZ01_LOCUS302534, partial [marine metagenome]
LSNGPLEGARHDKREALKKELEAWIAAH